MHAVPGLIHARTPPAVSFPSQVKPYYFDFKCFVKERWNGLNLVQLFSQEFPMLTEEYYTRAFHAGRLRVERQQPGGRPRAAGEQLPELKLETPLKTSMCVRHLIHRHEPPVLGGPVEVLRMTDEFVAVSKPACMPVHTVGQYRKNTVMGVLQVRQAPSGTSLNPRKAPSHPPNPRFLPCHPLNPRSHTHMQPLLFSPSAPGLPSGAWHSVPYVPPGQAGLGTAASGQVLGSCREDAQGPGGGWEGHGGGFRVKG